MGVNITFISPVTDTEVIVAETPPESEPAKTFFALLLLVAASCFQTSPGVALLLSDTPLLAVELAGYGGTTASLKVKVSAYGRGQLLVSLRVI